MTVFRALNKDGVEIGLVDVDNVAEAIKWAASVGVRGVIAIEKKVGEAWESVWKFDGTSAV